MSVRPKKVMAVRKFVNDQPPAAVPASSYTFPAPIRGWVLNENLATAQPAAARRLDNWLCTTTGVRARGGSVKHATLPAAVTSLFTYKGSTEQFFATTATGIFTITAPASPTTILTATVSGLTSGEFTAAQFGTAGGNYLYAVNGADSARLFDGAAWTAITGASSPSITGPTTSTFSHVWSFANRLFFVQKNTFTAWYLPVDSIGGAASSFSLAGVFKRGGSLLFGATWSQDSGAGLDDKCVFVSTEGDVAVYAGTNPGSAADWALQGVYAMPRPLGKNAHVQAGGDLLIATEVGLIPISAVLQTDFAALDGKAVSAQIAPYWQQMARTITPGWDIVKVPRRGVIFIAQPDPAGGEKTALAINSLTGAWSRCTGWDTRCLGYFNDQPYFGAGDNCVYIMDTSGADDGAPYTAVYLGQHESMGLFGKVKSIRQMRATFQSGSPINPYLSAQEDFREEVGTAPSSVANYTVDEWDNGLWDTAIWDADTVVQNDANWTAVGVTGYTIAPELQLTFGVTPTPVVELVSIDAEFHVGAGVA